MAFEELKAKVFAAIDANAEKIINIGDTIWKNPEPGYREFKTAALAAEPKPTPTGRAGSYLMVCVPDKQGFPSYLLPLPWDEGLPPIFSSSLHSFNSHLGTPFGMSLSPCLAWES